MSHRSSNACPECGYHLAWGERQELTGLLGLVRKVGRCPQCQAFLILGKWPFRLYTLSIVVYFVGLFTLLWILPHKRIFQIVTWMGLLALALIGRTIRIQKVGEKMDQT